MSIKIPTTFVKCEVSLHAILNHDKKLLLYIIIFQSCPALSFSDSSKADTNNQIISMIINHHKIETMPSRHCRQLKSFPSVSFCDLF